jgi:5'-nucleotidase
MSKIVYIDMDNTLVDFGAKLKGIHPSVLSQYEGRFDEIPGLFALMPPVSGALDAYEELHESFEVYILSTSPWGNPSAWQHKVEWVHLHLGIKRGTPAWKRLILSHHKNLNRGDYLIDDRPWHNGADRFEGGVIHFGKPSELAEGRTGWPENVVAHLDTWPAVVGYLKEHA